MNRSKLLFSLFLVFASTETAAQGRPTEFAAIKVQPTDAPKNLEFTLSAAAATSKSPVVVSVQGRKLRNSDRKYRTWLQKHWLSTYVPGHMKFVARALVECEYQRQNEYAFCDMYEFEHPASGKFESFYIYVGNWP